MTILTLAVAALLPASPASAHLAGITAKTHHHHAPLQHGRCHTKACFDRVWQKEHPAPPISELEACIIRKESGGDPQAVSGIYSGIGQWEQSRWESDGGLRYAPSPTGATYAQQEKVLRGEGEAGMIDQQGQYDGCG